VQVDAVALSTEPQLDAVVDHPFLLRLISDSRLGQQIDGALLEHTSSDRTST
jgi:hypothetical protein